MTSGQWSVVISKRGFKVSAHSASIDSDAARLLHLSDRVLRVRAAVGVYRQREREFAAVLPAARGAPLRDVHVHGRADARLGIGDIGPDDLPAVSWNGGVPYRAGCGVDG